jgi:acetate kinase
MGRVGDNPDMADVRVLVVNPGSSSLKLSVLDGDDVVAESEAQTSDGGVDEGALEEFLAGPGAAWDAAGVRVVHGGADFRSATRVDASVVDALDRISDLAPLHNPPAVHALRVLLAREGARPIIACFDTAFHAQMPDAAALYAVPWSWVTDLGVRRYGFHGLSHAYATRAAASMLGRPVESLCLVTCHLGAGASLAAVSGGVSVDTTMGFTPMEGLVMATRAGSVDAGAVLWVMRRLGMSPADMERVLDRESGLFGLSGVAGGDMRAVLAEAERGSSRARLALDVYVHRLRRSIGAMAAALPRVDALVFTGGVGENSPVIRERACAGLSVAAADVPVLVVHAREDAQVAYEVRALLG